MARLFDDASTEYLKISTAAVTTGPYTMSIWFFSDDTDQGGCLLNCSASSPNEYFQLNFREGTADQVRFLRRGSEGTNELRTTTQANDANVWNHAACSDGSGDASPSVYLNGGGKSSNTTERTYSAIDQTEMALNTVSGSEQHKFSGRLAESAIWNVVLSDGEIALLAKGFSPLLFRPQNLVGYWPLIRDDDQDRVGDLNMTAFNTPTVSAHPPNIIYPAPPFISYPVAAVAGNAMPMAMHQYRMRRVAA